MSERLAAVLLRTSISILLLSHLLLAGCEDHPAVAMSPASADSISQVETTIPAVEPVIAPDAATEGTPELTTAAAEPPIEISGKVVGIIDGDTIDILKSDKTTIRIRLNGIDAPEIGQPFGRNAKQFLSEKIGGQFVKVVTHGEDRYGRMIGDVFMKNVPGPNFLPGTVLPDWNINREIVQEGLAWHFKKYSSDIYLHMDEITARDRKFGLWSDVRSIPPWEWRKLSKAERDKLR